MCVAPSGLQAASSLLRLVSGQGRARRVAVFGPEVAAKGSCAAALATKKAAGGRKTGSLMPEPPFSDGGLCWEPHLLSDCDMDDSAEAALCGMGRETPFE